MNYKTHREMTTKQLIKAKGEAERLIARIDDLLRFLEKSDDD